jgi:DMSO/TMAO reductase YedYZ molybdopterin-dependent catalytic subunit
MRLNRRLTLLGTGLLAGVVAALAMALVMVAARTWLGISPLPESVPDRLAPTLSIKQFFDLFGKYGGYNGLKKFGIKSGLEGLLGAGVVVGLLYSVIVESRKSRSTGSWKLGLSRLGLLFVGALVVLMWVGSVILLWPVLQANYRGLPPSQARYVTAAGLLVTYLVFAVVLIGTYRFVAARAARVTSAVDADSTYEAGLPEPAGKPYARRAVVAAGVGAVLAWPSYVLIKRLYDRAVFPYDGTVYNGPGIQPVTPNDRFYTVTKNVVDPNVDKSVWGLEISGLVEHGKTIKYDDLAALPAVKQETTLMCISNAVGGGLTSNAVWTGVPMRDLLNEAAVKPGAVEVKLYGADGYTDTFAIEKALDPATMVVYQMNGEALAERHGYPARVIVPGLYGEKNVKWVTGIEVIDHDGKGFYETQGWGPDFTIHVRSDIYSPRRTQISGPNFKFNDSFPVNKPVQLQGRAFAGNKGVKSVEFSSDDGKTWLPAKIDYPGTSLTQVFWSHQWTPAAPGDYTLTSRATDGEGTVQSTDVHSTVPQGASGYCKVKAHVV